jgi:hypothetical protein
MTSQLKPGFNDTSELWDLNMKRLNRFVKEIILFFNINLHQKCVDIGESNPKMELIKHKLKIKVDQLVVNDLNFDKLQHFDKYDIIFALDIIEHLQNPLWFVNELKNILNDNGSIYVMMPCNRRWLWMEGHYFELDKKHFDKWIIKPLGLKIVKYKLICFIMDWRSILIGIRPLIKYVKGKRSMVSLVRGFLYTRWGLYEIKKDSL